MTRALCLHREDCAAPSTGICTRCQPEAAAARSERMRRLNAKPEFAKERNARSSAWMREMNTNPVFAAFRAQRQREGVVGKLRAIGVKEGAEETYRFVRTKKIDRAAAARIANDSLRAP